MSFQVRDLNHQSSHYKPNPLTHGPWAKTTSDVGIWGSDTAVHILLCLFDTLSIKKKKKLNSTAVSHCLQGFTHFFKHTKKKGSGGKAVETHQKKPPGCCCCGCISSETQRRIFPTARFLTNESARAWSYFSLPQSPWWMNEGQVVNVYYFPFVFLLGIVILELIKKKFGVLKAI